MTEKSEALRLAECLDEPLYATHKQMTEAAAELRRLADIERRFYELQRHGVSRAAYEKVEAQRDALLAALKELTPPMPPADAPCHVGLVPQEKCAHCGRIARARAAIKQAEGKNP